VLSIGRTISSANICCCGTADKMKLESRSKDYMKGIDEDDTRKKRDSLLVELRKNKRDDMMTKRRQQMEERFEGPNEPSFLPEHVAQGQQERVRQAEFPSSSLCV